MAQRFKSYKRALHLIKDPNASADADLVIDRNSPLYLYHTKDTRNITYTRQADSKPKAILEVSVKPFGAAPDTTALAIVSFSKRVDDEESLNAVKTACNHVAVDYSAHSTRSGFKPAKAIVFVPGTQSTTKVASKITGVYYDPREGKSFTLPYGQKTGAIYEAAVRAEIQTAIDGLSNDDVTLSFKSEVYS